MPRITSRDNPRLKEAGRLINSARDRRKAGRCVLEGAHVVAAYRARHGPPETLIIAESALDQPEMAALRAGVAESRTLIVSERAWSDLAQIPSDIAVIAVVPTPQSTFRSASDFCLLLEDVQDPGNVGALVRSAAAFDFSGVLLSDKCADPFGPKAVQASAGTILSVWVRKTKEFHTRLRELADNGYYCVAADIRGTEMLRKGGTPRFVLVLGNEGSGLSAEGLQCAHSVMRIPINTAKAESLNVAAGGAVCMFALTGM